MSEKSERLFQAMSQIGEEKIDEAAAEPPGKKRRVWLRWTALAAVLALVVGVGSQVLPRLGGSASNGGADGGGADGGSVFMSYAGPVFPLALAEENGALTAAREVTLDFAPWVPVWVSNEEDAAAAGLTGEAYQQALEQNNEWFPDGGYYRSSNDILVTDFYTLTNHSGEDQQVKILYPFVSAADELDELTPALTLNGQAVETALRAGGYSGGFQGALGNDMEESEPGSVNLRSPRGWEDYKALLSDGAYLDRALGDWPDLSGVPVTVYRFTDPWGEERDEQAGRPNPSIRVMFDVDYDKTQVLTTGFHAGYYDREHGVMGRGFSIPQPGEWDYGQDRWNLIVVGEDISNLTTQGYVTGGWDTDRTIRAGVTVERYETDLDTALRTLFLEEQWSEWGQSPEEDRPSGLSYEMYCGLCFDELLTYGLLSDTPVERYDSGMLEELDFRRADRVFYLEAEVAVPAGGSVELTASLTKKASFDHYCAHTQNRGVYGYDLVTRLGSGLTFTGQSARLEDRGQIEIVRQNFGFDLENGVTSVALDPEQEHYYLEVKRPAQGD